MLKWYYRLKAARRERAGSYAIRDRPCRTRLGAGFTGYLENTHFYGGKSERYGYRRWRRRVLAGTVALVLIAGSAWVVVESVRHLMTR